DRPLENVRPLMSQSGLRLAVAGSGVPHAHGQLSRRVRKPPMLMLDRRGTQERLRGRPGGCVQRAVRIEPDAPERGGVGGLLPRSIPEANGVLAEILRLLP